MAVNASATPSTTELNPKNTVPLWRRLTEPDDAVKQPEHRRQARLLAGILVFLIPLGLAASVVPPLLTPRPGYSYLRDPGFIGAMTGLLFLIIAYVFSRTQHYTIGSTITVVVIPVMAFGAVIADPTLFELIMVYLSLVILLASLLFSIRGTLITVVALLLALEIVPLFIPGMAPSSRPVINMLIFNGLMAALMVVGAAIRHRDLEQIEQQSHDLAEAVQAAEYANKLKDQFLANMSHELRTPLNAIIGFSEVMMMGLTGELPAESERAIERVHHNSERLLTLIDDILDISRIEAGRVEILRQPFKPTDLLNSVEQSVKPQASVKGLEIATLLDPNLPEMLLGDFKRLEQILINLTANAVKFTDTGRVLIALKRVDMDTWSIEVSDTGIGIPVHALETIFEKFRQVDGTSRRAYGGTGLGLAIVRELALLMNGNVKVQSKLRVGSTFTVTLPMLIPERARA